MKTAEELKTLVKEKYGEIAEQSKEQNAVSCCGVGTSCNEMDYSIFAEDYTSKEGYVADADLALGCGIPVDYAGMKPGQTVLDLGSGAGNDVFVARTIVGKEGEVIGLDMTEAMIEKARNNAKKLGFDNVKFRLGDIEKMPFSANRVDVIISNCVLNLVPDKKQAFSEIHRVLKPGGHFCISDVVIKGQLPEGLQHAAEMYAGCVTGAIQKWEYLGIIHETGFENVTVQTEKEIVIPDEILLNYIPSEELDQFKASGSKIMSITVKGEKAGAEPCCEPGTCC